MHHLCVWLSPFLFFGGHAATSGILAVQNSLEGFSLRGGSDSRCGHHEYHGCHGHCTKSAQEPQAIGVLR